MPYTDVIDNAKISVITKEQGDDYISSLAALGTQPVEDQNINLIMFDKFSSYQKLLRVTAYMLRLLPSDYPTVDISITEPVELEKAEHHLQYLFRRASLSTKRKNFFDNKPLGRAAASLSSHLFVGIRSSDRLRLLVEFDFDRKHHIVLDVRHTFAKLFLWQTQLKNHH